MLRIRPWQSQMYSDLMSFGLYRTEREYILFHAAHVFLIYKCFKENIWSMLYVGRRDLLLPAV